MKQVSSVPFLSLLTDLGDEDFEIPSRKSTTLDKEVGLTGSRTGMKAMSVFELCP